MNFKKHLELEGRHAFLGGSNYHWINYDEEKITNSYTASVMKFRGTELHDFASTCIKLGQKLPKSKKTLNMFVNDAIGFKMSSEQALYYSENCFGHADAISFRNNFLRIHDYKTGTVKANMNQLKIYAAIFCLEYKINPKNINIELRIYQYDSIEICNPIPEEIEMIMQKIIMADKVIDKIKYEGV